MSGARATIVVSDLHLGEGKHHWDGSFNILEDFTVDQRFSEFLDFYSKAYDSVELVLNGNFFEMQRCRAVHDYPDVLFETYSVELIRVSIEGHPIVVEALKRFMTNPNNTLVYILGDADVGVFWGKVQDELRRRISDRIRFVPNYYLNRGIHIEHGHQYDSMSAIDVQQPFQDVNGLPVLKLPWGSFFHAHFIQPLRRVRPQFYRVRPMRNYLVWAFLFETRFALKVVSQFIKMLFYSTTRHFYPGNSLWTIFRVFSQSADTEALEDYAEILLSSDHVQKVIFGHSHIPNYRQFHNGKEYFNVGTWTKNLSLDLRSLGSFHKLTYVLIEFRSDADSQAKLMEWHGKYEPIEDFV